MYPETHEVMHRMREINLALSRLIDEHQERAKRAAEATHVYKLACASKRPVIKEEQPRATVADLDAALYVEFHDLALKAAVEEALADSSKEALRARRDQLGACQSELAALRAEAELVKTGPTF